MAKGGIKVVESFKATDGVLFEDRATAHEHQAKINLLAALEELCQSAPNRDRETIIDFITTNRIKLTALLNEHS